MLDKFIEGLNNATIIVIFVFMTIILYAFDIISVNFAANICFVLFFAFIVDSIWRKNE